MFHNSSKNKIFLLLLLIMQIFSSCIDEQKDIAPLMKVQENGDLVKFYQKKLIEFNSKEINDSNLYSFFTELPLKLFEKLEITGSAYGELQEILLYQEDRMQTYINELDTLQALRSVSITSIINGHVNPKFKNIDTIKLSGTNRKGNWIQDHFLVSRAGDSIILVLEPILFKKNKFYGKELEQSSYLEDYEIISSRIGFPIEGGNLLVGDDFLLIGKDVVDYLSLFFNSEISKKIGLFDKLSKYQKTLENEERTFIGDSLITKIIQKILVPQNDKEIILINQKGIRHDLTNLKYEQNYKNGFVLDPYDVRHHIDYFITLGGRDKDSLNILFLGEFENIDKDTSNERDKVFGEIKAWRTELKKELERKFKVIDLKNYCQRDKEGWYCFTYNNSIIEVTNENKTVYLPQYVTDKITANSFNQMAIDTFETGGFEVVRLNHFTKMMYKDASAHCLIKTIFRTKLKNNE